MSDFDLKKTENSRLLLEFNKFGPLTLVLGCFLDIGHRVEPFSHVTAGYLILLDEHPEVLNQPISLELEANPVPGSASA